ncbi:malto-oligosyltrehalose synthase [Paracoccus stylophorae]|uniref:Malto-oligosyltrehalose synthase n=1 Tax=Paracoccus stylophorae TaxID=659350 RepID=A0ABY7SVG6_9RHOB|nr:malto-oligosyltrehalose synthase [Paracoccus stylophorae]WCR10834.1 malto-oligosyltrehalose synthase [Paracoccus stylophorae]
MRHLPASCYRLQLRGGMDFDRAERVLGYLERLGITHLYLSPIFAAQPGSSHGYDVIDPTVIDAALGGRAGFDRLAVAARARGIGIVLDIVPNHMAFTLDNPWLRDLLAKGDASRYRAHFDIAPDRRLVLPMLPAPFEDVLQDGGFAVEDDEGGPVLVHGPLRVPLDARTMPDTLPGPDDRAAIRALHDRQFWRLCHWRAERDAITHRRFFSISGLIGVRVEDARVFEDTHRLIIELCKSGTVAGLRIDHIDGLADPAAYLERLRDRLPDTPLWVEKIIAPDETLPDWPIAGTTGYVLARDIAQVLTDTGGARRIDDFYRGITGRTADFGDVVASAKRQVLETELAAELWQLHAMVMRAAADDPVAAEYGPETWRRAIVELIAHLDRYRPYLDDSDPRPEDVAALEDAASRAAEDAERHAVDFLLRCLLDPDGKATALRLRFQQVSGAVMAKGQEDTAFYRYNALIGANEVGAEPDRPAIDAATFHARMHARMRDMPQGLSLTSSHDTKRSEDARARLAALSHHPDAAEALFAAASAVDGADAVDPNLRWYLVQSLWAMMPGCDGRDDLATRLCDHATKAMREAKEGTSWQDPNEAFEAAGLAFVRSLARALDPLPAATQDAARTASRLSLAQVALKLTLPGIPDIYQDCEIGNYRLTDPDNRAPVDFARLDAALDDPATLLRKEDREKLDLTRRLLGLRRDEPVLFAAGEYLPDDQAPAGTVGFRRVHGNSILRVLVSAPAPLDAQAVAARAGEVRIWPPADHAMSECAVALFRSARAEDDGR